MSGVTVGWREWVNFPDLELAGIKAKIDTGARTSSLHAFNIERFSRNRQDWVRFHTQPRQYQPDPVIFCECILKDKRLVTDSGGHREERFVIETRLQLGEECWPVEISLTNRSDMKFRMLLGRHAMRKRLIVNPSVSYLCGDYKHIYSQFESELNS